MIYIKLDKSQAMAKLQQRLQIQAVTVKIDVVNLALKQYNITVYEKE